MPSRTFEALDIGETAESIGRTVSESEVYRFAGLAGAYGQIHTNREYVRDLGHDDLVAQGVLSLAYINGLRTTLPWSVDVISLYGLENTRFVAPVYVGDTVHLESEVAEKRVKDDRRGVVTFREHLVKHDDTLAVACDWLTLVRRD